MAERKDDPNDTVEAPAPALFASRYRLENVLGTGGMGEVVIAHDVVLGRAVAVKRLTEAKQITEVHRARLLKEARAVALLNHPHVVAVYDAGETDDHVPFIVMEVVSGGSLRERLRKGPPPSLATSLGWLVEIADGLAAAHRAGIVHRDVKPENLLVTDEGHVKIADFGVVKEVGRAPLHDGLATREGFVVGTPAFMAPEQMRGDSIDGRVDQFALGIVGYLLITGVHPLRSLGVADQDVADGRFTAPPLRELVPSAPASLEAIIARMLSPQSEARFADMSEVKTLLEGVVSERRSAPEPPALTATPPVRFATPQASGSLGGAAVPDRVQPKKSRGVGFALAALGTLAAIGAAVVLTTHFPRRTVAAPVAPDASAVSSARANALVAFAAGIKKRNQGLHPTYELAKAFKLDPSFATAQVRTAWSLAQFNESRSRSALEAAKQARASLEPDEQALVDALDPMLAAPPDYAKGIATLRNAAASSPKNSELVCALGMAAAFAGDPDRLALVRSCLTLAPERLDVARIEAIVLLVDGIEQEGLARLDACVDAGGMGCRYERLAYNRDHAHCDAVVKDATPFLNADFFRNRDLVEGDALFGIDAEPALVSTSLGRGRGRAGPDANATTTFLVKVLKGDLENAASQRRLDAAKGSDNDSIQRRVVASLVDVEEELGHPDQAASAAATYLSQRKPFARTLVVAGAGESIGMLARIVRAARRTSRIDDATAHAAIASEMQGATWSAEATWLYGTAMLASTPAEAKRALETSPLGEKGEVVSKLDAGDASYELGRLYGLAGDDDRAESELLAATHTCRTLSNKLLDGQAMRLLAERDERKGDKKAACDAYGEVVARFTGGESAKKAAVAVRRLHCK